MFIVFSYTSETGLAQKSLSMLFDGILMSTMRMKSFDKLKSKDYFKMHDLLIFISNYFDFHLYHLMSDYF